MEQHKKDSCDALEGFIYQLKLMEIQKENPKMRLKNLRTELKEKASLRNWVTYYFPNI